MVSHALGYTIFYLFPMFLNAGKTMKGGETLITT